MAEYDRIENVEIDIIRFIVSVCLQFFYEEYVRVISRLPGQTTTALFPAVAISSF